MQAICSLSRYHCCSFVALVPANLQLLQLSQILWSGSLLLVGFRSGTCAVSKFYLRYSLRRHPGLSSAVYWRDSSQLEYKSESMTRAVVDALPTDRPRHSLLNLQLRRPKTQKWKYDGPNRFYKVGYTGWAGKRSSAFPSLMFPVL